MPPSRTSSGSPYEDSIGFCRAMRTGNRIVVAGTGPIAADGSTAAPGDAYGQAKRCLEIIVTAIEDLGGTVKTSCAPACFWSMWMTGRPSAVHTAKFSRTQSPLPPCLR